MKPTSSLLSDDGFARRIAIGLLRDREGAEDLVQEAWLTVLEKPPRHDSNPRGYLATILARLRLRKRRSEGRRVARERSTARDGAVPEAAELVARAEIHQRTVAAVLALDEPYRATVLLRFFEDLTPEEIATREHLPADTVRTRLKRALSMLRARLEREGRDWREEWAVALAGGGWPEELTRSSTRGPLPRWGVAAGVATTALVIWLARAVVGSRESQPLELPAPPTRFAQGPSEPSVLTTMPTEERTVLLGEVSPPMAVSDPIIPGRAVDTEGRPVAGVRVELRVHRFIDVPGRTIVISDDEGKFSLSLADWSQFAPPVRGLYDLIAWAWKPGYAPHSGVVELGTDRMPVESELLIELRPGRVFFARVVDPAGAPVADVNVQAGIRPAEPTRKPRIAATFTDRDGWFAYGLEPGECLIDLLLRHAETGFAFFGEVDLPALTDGDVDFGPIPLDPGRAVRGRCIYPDGAPASGIQLGAFLAEPDLEGGFRQADRRPRDELPSGLTSVVGRTDASGRFAFQGLRAGPFQIHSGNQSSTLMYPLADGAVWDSGGPEIEVVFPDHRLGIEVVGPDDRLVEEARVAITPLSRTGDPEDVPQRFLTLGSPPLALLRVEPSQRFAVLAVVPGWSSVEELVEIPALPYETKVRLRLGVEDRRAILALRPRAGDVAHWQVDLCAPLSSTPLPGFQDLVPGADGRVRELPLGSYRVRVQPRPHEDADAIPRSCAADASTPVTLVAGETSLEFDVQHAARMRVLFEGAAVSARRFAPMHGGELASSGANIDPDLLEGAGAGRWDWLVGSMSASRGSLELWAVRPDGERLLRRLTGLRPSPGRRLDLVVPAAPLRLRLALEGRPAIERELAPVPGETIEIPVPLDETATVR